MNIIRWKTSWLLTQLLDHRNCLKKLSGFDAASIIIYKASKLNFLSSTLNFPSRSSSFFITLSAESSVAKGATTVLITSKIAWDLAAERPLLVSTLDNSNTGFESSLVGLVRLFSCVLDGSGTLVTLVGFHHAHLVITLQARQRLWVARCDRIPWGRQLMRPTAGTWWGDQKTPPARSVDFSVSD